MYNEQIESLINAALADGVLTEKEKQILFKKAQSMGIDLDEFEMVLDARLIEHEKAEKEKASQSAPKSNKYGDVRKCPVCGAIVQAYQAKCPECGYEFSNVDANMSSQKLADEVKKAQTEAEKKQCIVLFPVPNTKADLLEFLTSLQPKMRDVRDPLSFAYFKKYQECITKAQVSFADDSIVKPFIDSFEKERKTLKRKQIFNDIKYWSTKHKKLSFFIVVIILIAIYSAIDSVSTVLSKSEKTDFNMCKAAVTKALQQNDYVTAQRLVDEFKYEGEGLTKLYVLLIPAYLENDLVENAKKLADDRRHQETCTPVYNYLINNGMYDEAADYIYNKYSYEEDKNYYEYMKDCVNKMLELGQKDQAKKFVTRKASHFIDKSAESDYAPDKIKKKLNAIIESY